MGMFKDARRAIDSRNEIMARSGIPGYSEKAKADLQKSRQRQAAASVVKHAAVGGIIAGPAGAVVGAVAAKAKQDAKKPW